MIVEGYYHLSDRDGRVFARQAATFEVTDEEIINVSAVRLTVPEQMNCTLPLHIDVLLPIGEIPVGDPTKREMPDAGSDLLIGAGTISVLS